MRYTSLQKLAMAFAVALVAALAWGGIATYAAIESHSAYGDWRNSATAWMQAAKTQEALVRAHEDQAEIFYDHYNAVRTAGIGHCAEAYRREFGLDVWPVEELYYQLERCAEIIDAQADRNIARSE